MAIYPSARIRLHEVLIRGKADTTQITSYEDGAAIVPTGATVQLQEPDGTSVFGPVAATIAGGGTCSYAVSPAQLPATLDLSDGYLLFCELTLATGAVLTFRRPCAVTLSKLYPVITDLDLIANYSDIANIRPASMTSYQGYIDEAWIRLITRIRDQGNYEYLIMDPQSLRACHLDLALYLIFRDFDSTGLSAENRYMELAREHMNQYTAAFDRLNFRYDLDQDNQMDDGTKRRGAVSVIYTSDPPPYYSRVW